MPQRLEYDEQGSTSYYFLLSFYALILLPATYFLWPYKRKDDAQNKLVCMCDPCRHKRAMLADDQPRETHKKIAKIVVLLVMWALLFLMLYKVFTADVDYQEYDPFSILELDPAASMTEIKKQYRRLSKVYHPDKQGGDQNMFIKIAKAYEALTDDTSRENWIKYGNPDGPQAATFGIALPSWVVEKQYSVLVIGGYLLVFVIILPIIVGTWWYRSIKYGTTNLLIETTKVYFYFLSKHKQLNMRRLIMILTAAFEFNPQFSKKMPPRPSDDQELCEIIRSKTLPLISTKVKEPVLGEPFAMKACILLHAHLEKYPLPPATLRIDQRVLLKFSPRLVIEMVNILNQVWVFARYRPSGPQNYTMPSVDVYECTMKLSQMIVQQMWDRQSPLLQLPHIQQDMLRHFRTRKRNINTVEQFTAMKNKDRRQLVRDLSDEDYLDVMAVCAGFPHISINTEIQVMDDDDTHKVTAGSIVTLSVYLTRTGLLEHYGVNTETLLSPDEEDTQTAEEQQEVETVAAVEKPSSKGQRSWDKSKKKKKKGKQSSGGRGGKKQGRGGVVQGRGGKEVKREEEAEEEEEEEAEEGRGKEEEGGGGGGGSSGSGSEEEVDEEKEWRSLQETMKKKKKAKEKGGGKDSHPVHSPFFPDVKQESWWIYVVDKKKQEMVVIPQKVSGLRTTLSQDLQFSAPEKQCTLKYAVTLMSDSYMGLQYSTELKIEVFERMEVKGRGQWEELEREEEEEEAFEESETEEEEEEESSGSED